MPPTAIEMVTIMFVRRCFLALACAILPILANGATVQVFATDLSGASESPANASPGTGEAIVTYAPGTLMMRVQATFSGLVGTTTAAHIHCCITSGTTAGVATQTPYFTGFPLGVTSGSYDHTFDMTQASSYNPAFVTANVTIGAALGALLAGMADGTAYFNVHTNVYPGGEIRGNLTLDTLFTDDFE